MSNIFQQVALRDSDESIVRKTSMEAMSLSLRDAFPGVYNKKYSTSSARKVHDANFAFVTTKLSKLHTKMYEPIVNTTYAQDVPIDVGSGLVDFVDWYSVEWAGMPTAEQNLTGNNVNVVPRVNAKLNHNKVDVFNFEIAYDIKFVEIDKLNKLAFQKSIDAIYKDAILAGWDLFCDKIAYVGPNGNDGLFTSENVFTTVVPAGSQDATKDGLAAMSDAEIVGLINGILSHYLINTNNNIKLLPDRILLPMTDSTELSSRFSTLYTNTLRNFLMNFNVGIDEASASGFDGYKLRIAGRTRLNGAGSLEGGRIVAYKFDKDFVRMDIPYPVQSYYTAPNVDRLCYTTFFVGQVSQIQMPYNKDNTSTGAVTYWDLTPGTQE